MSTLTTPAPSHRADDAGSVGGMGGSGSDAPGPGLWRRRRALLLLALALVVVVVGAVLLGSGGPERGGRLDPDNPTPTGGQAVARVLADQGVDVTVVRSAAALEDADVDDGTTVLVSDPLLLGERTAESLMDDRRGARLVVADPEFAVTDLLGLDVQGTRESGLDDVAADCSGAGSTLGDDLDGLEISVDRAFAFPGLDGCFAVDGAPTIAETDDEVLLLGADDLLTNDQVLRADNAAVALRLLGGTEQLVWYVPDPADLADDEGVGLGAFAPDAVVPALWLTVAAVVALMWWRGRRFGRLVVEPLPVSVRAVEATESRGRLYRRTGDRFHAADALRRASRRRIAVHLGLPRHHVDPVALVHDVAARTGRPVAYVGSLLDPRGPLPTDDAALVTFAHLLTDLEKEVRRA